MSDHAPREHVRQSQARHALNSIRRDFDKLSYDNPDRQVVMPILELLDKQQELTPQSVAKAVQDVLGQTRYKEPRRSEWGRINDHSWGTQPIAGSGHQQPDFYYHLVADKLFNQRIPSPIALAFAGTPVAPATGAHDFFRKAAPAAPVEPKPKAAKVDRAAITDAFVAALEKIYPKGLRYGDENFSGSNVLENYLRQAILERRDKSHPFQREEMHKLAARYDASIAGYSGGQEAVERFHADIDTCFDRAWLQVTGNPAPAVTARGMA